MPAVLFRPHFISALEVSGEQDENGDFVSSSENWSRPVPCRFEPNGRASTVPVGEDRDYVYAYTVYLDRNCPEFRYGQLVRIFDECCNSIGDFRVRGFHRWQLVAKLWV